VKFYFLFIFRGKNHSKLKNFWFIQNIYTRPLAVRQVTQENLKEKKFGIASGKPKNGNSC
jgi:hypothetical protein